MKNTIWQKISLAVSVSVVASQAFAQATNTDVQNAQNQATIATSNATVATAAATAANAQATAQQALLASQLANQKNDIANIQAALQAPDASKLKMSGTLTAPSVVATYNKILTDKLSAWLTDSKAESPIKDLASCSSIFLNRPSLPSLTLTYKATDGKLKTIWRNLTSATQDISGTPVAPGGAAAGLALLPAIAGVDALANIFLNVAAAAKQQTGIGSQSINAASKIVIAAVSSRIPSLNKPFYDSDSSIDVSYDAYGTTNTCTTTTEAEFGALNLVGKSSCVADAIEKAQKQSQSTQNKLPTLDPKSKTPDPNAALRTKLDALAKLLTQAKTDFQALFNTDTTSGMIPFNSAVQGEIYDALLKKDDSCILSLNAISSDADTVVRDGTFSSYKLSIATTTAVSWTIATPKGKIQKAGFVSLTTNWEKQALGE